MEDYGVESVFILGDFNANISVLFYKELLNFCCEQSLTCIDVDILGVNSGTYTCISEAHGSCSWLDHCIVTQAAKQTVISAWVDYDILWSDHFPLIIECNLSLLVAKLEQLINYNSKNVIWGDRNEELVANYIAKCHKRLRLIDFPSECKLCADFYCDNREHRQVLDRLYADIVTALSTAVGRGDEGCESGWTRSAFSGME
jgi:hypothetical protein